MPPRGPDGAVIERADARCAGAFVRSSRPSAKFGKSRTTTPPHSKEPLASTARRDSLVVLEVVLLVVLLFVLADRVPVLLAPIRAQGAAAHEQGEAGPAASTTNVSNVFIVPSLSF